MKFTRLNLLERSRLDQKKDYICFSTTFVFLTTALTLSIFSWMRLCSQACAEGHDYRLFGFTFEAIGFLFFSTLIITHLLSYKIVVMGTLTGWMLCSSLGAEVMFIYVQKYKIGSWCPICLFIATMLILSGGIYLWGFCVNFKKNLESGDGDQIMNTTCKGLTGIIFFVIGFVLAFSGIDKHSKLQAAENSVKEGIAFGDLHSPIEVYVFTDWACPACRSLESALESMIPTIMQKAKLTFVDDPVHSETLNYTPYNLSFMINNKSHYLKLRNRLSKLSVDTEVPTDAQVEALASEEGAKYKQLNYADVALATKYFDHLIKKLEVVGTPTVVIVNSKTNKAKKLEGGSEITQKNVLKAIETFSSDK